MKLSESPGFPLPVAEKGPTVAWGLGACGTPKYFNLRVHARLSETRRIENLRRKLRGPLKGPPEPLWVVAPCALNDENQTTVGGGGRGNERPRKIPMS